MEKTKNGHEIKNPTSKMSASEYLDMLRDDFNIDGATGQEKLEQFKKLSNEGIAILLEEINKGIQGSEDSLMSEKVVRIGDEATLPIESRYEVFTSVVDSIRSAPSDINPDRIADTLALSVLLLHPFKDGNGRTARLIGLTFRDKIGSENFDFNQIYELATESREDLRKKKVFIDGYIPYLPEGQSQSDPEAVIEYIKSLLTTDNPRLYYNPFNRGMPEPLKKPSK